MKQIAPPNGPGWTHETRTGVSYWVWAPRPAKPELMVKARDCWKACWQSADGDDGDFVNGPDLASVLKIFPTRIRGMFREVADPS